MGRQNVQAKEVYWHDIVSEVYFCLFFLMFIINICLIFFTAVKTANYNYHIIYYNLVDDVHVLNSRLGSTQSSMHKLEVKVLNTNLFV